MAHLAVEANGTVSGPRQGRVRNGGKRFGSPPRRCGEWSWKAEESRVERGVGTPGFFARYVCPSMCTLNVHEGYDRMSEARPGAPTRCADSTASNAALAPQMPTVKLGKAIDWSSGQGWRQNGF